MQKLTSVFGWLGLAIGIVVAVAAPLPGWGTPIAFICMLPGFLFSSLFVLYSTKYQIKTKWVNPGYVGMLLNSTPLLLLFYFQFIK
jgi:hypothetical protein